MTETETETEDSDNLKCEIMKAEDGVWSKVSNPSSATINGLQVQVRPQQTCLVEAHALLNRHMVGAFVRT
jgi:hypothetical protein